MAASSSSDVQSRPHQHQVFINFRGDQLRNQFVSHLYTGLRGAGINAFMDVKDGAGKSIDDLFKRIEESRIVLAVFSSRYAESKWCLNELVKMKERMDEGKLVVIPIFYKLKPSDVKHLEGEFGRCFVEQVRSHADKVHQWKQALVAVLKYRGLILDQGSDEGRFVNDIIEEVTNALTNISTAETGNTCSSTNTLADVPPTGGGRGQSPVETRQPSFGLEASLRQLKEIVNICSDKTRLVGIVGMPGIGKTTLAKILFEDCQQNFMQKVFMGDISDSRKSRVEFLKELWKSNPQTGQDMAVSPESLNAMLRARKAFVVLDGISDWKQVEHFLGECNWISSGSRIVITTRDMSVIEGKVDDTYVVPRLNEGFGLQCFHYYAFDDHNCDPSGNFMKLSRDFVDCTKGHPLALKILGRDLCRKDESHWKEKLAKLVHSSDNSIQEIFEISCKELIEKQKDAFLDIACFFRSMDEGYTSSLLDSCDAESDIRVLADKFLINISGGRVEMHDLLHKFGMELGSMGKRVLWSLIDLLSVQNRKVERCSVRGISLDMSKVNRIPLDRGTFAKMNKLRYLKIYNSYCHRECEASSALHFPDGLDQFIMEELRYLHWLNFPMEELPREFNPKNLIDLRLPYSKITQVWNGVKDTPKLKWVDLSHSTKLSNLSGLLGSENLQRLNLEGCTTLDKLPNMNSMKSLAYLNLRGCTSLQSLPKMSLVSLKTLILSGCSNLKEFRPISKNLETLYLDGTAIVELPPTIKNLQRLILLNMKDCKILERLPDCLDELKSLEQLILSGCSKLNSFPVIKQDMKGLKTLLLDGTASDLGKPNRSEGQVLCEWPRDINALSSLQRLCLSGNNSISYLQHDISQLYHLKWLDLNYCKNLASLPTLPPNLEFLYAIGCKKLKRVASPLALLAPTEQIPSTFIFTNCNNLEQAAKYSISSYAQRRSQLDALKCHDGGVVSKSLFRSSFPGCEIPSWFSHQAVGSVLEPKLPPHWCDGRLTAVALCAVVSFQQPRNQVNRISVECNCKFKNEDGSCIVFRSTLGGWIQPPGEGLEMESDHIFMGHTCCLNIGTSLREKHSRKCVPTEAVIEFNVVRDDGTSEVEGCQVVNCGLSLVYAEPNNVPGEQNPYGSSRRDVVSEENNRPRWGYGFSFMGL